MTVSIHRLPDGRSFGYYEYGDPHGVPCLYFPGTPVSGISGGAYDETAREAGVRLISMDKPGYGHSDLHAAGSLLTAVDDAVALAASLGIQRFAVVGESGGGPYALATAFRVPELVTVSVVLVGMGPGDEDWAREGMNAINKVSLFAAQRATWLLRPIARYAEHSFKKLALAGKQEAASAPEAARRLADIDYQAIVGGFRQGTGGVIHESKLLARSWGFELADIPGRVELWHGTEDVNVPIRLARHVESLLPDGHLHELAGVAHDAGRIAAAEVMRTIEQASRPGGR